MHELPLSLGLIESSLPAIPPFVQSCTHHTWTVICMGCAVQPHLNYVLTHSFTQFNYDQISKLDPWKTTILLRIRGLISGDAGGDASPDAAAAAAAADEDSGDALSEDEESDDGGVL